MKKSYFVFLFLAAMIVAIYAAWNIAYPSGTWRYKMTVTVETPEGIKTGSAAREIHVAAEPRIPESAPHPQVIGEAIVIDLEKRGQLFALLGSDYAYAIVYKAFPSASPPRSPDGIRYYSQLKAGTKVLALEQYPVFVHFKDVNDPKTVEYAYGRVYCTIRDKNCTRGAPYQLDRLEEIYGQGVRIKEVTIEMTDEPVTWEITRWLPWLSRLKSGYLSGKRSSFGLMPKDQLQINDFIKR